MKLEKNFNHEQFHSMTTKALQLHNNEGILSVKYWEVMKPDFAYTMNGVL